MSAGPCIPLDRMVRAGPRHRSSRRGLGPASAGRRSVPEARTRLVEHAVSSPSDWRKRRTSPRGRIPRQFAPGPVGTGRDRGWRTDPPMVRSSPAVLPVILPSSNLEGRRRERVPGRGTAGSSGAVVLSSFWSARRTDDRDCSRPDRDRPLYISRSRSSKVICNLVRSSVGRRGDRDDRLRVSPVRWRDGARARPAAVA
jgi:hypothetical protein